MRWISMFVLALVMCLIVSRETSAGAAAIGLRGEQVTQLPEDAGYWQTVVLLSGNNDVDQSLLAAFNHTPGLQRLVKQTTFSALAPDHFWCKKNYPGQPRPTVLVMGPNGERVYQASGPNLPSSGEALASEIETQLEAVGQCGPNCPDGKCPLPPVRPHTPDGRPARPDLRPDSPAANSDGLLLFLCVAVLFVVVGYFATRPPQGDS